MAVVYIISAGPFYSAPCPPLGHLHESFFKHVCSQYICNASVDEHLPTVIFPSRWQRLVPPLSGSHWPALLTFLLVGWICLRFYIRRIRLATVKASTVNKVGHHILFPFLLRLSVGYLVYCYCHLLLQRSTYNKV